MAAGSKETTESEEELLFGSKALKNIFPFR
ncbi:hypothetical protein PanWU01x14_029720 [Parasponia andersonii]|uniref:Uncharacterized protein n=1 Tax=Parasponia andersonii TaxID=3476 RepID=A0A2P5DVL8_PARAD|nr:hypothetical protein PanWU01x14_029720 [Parasponia andersonii]